MDALLAMQRRSANDPPVPNAQQEPHWPVKARVMLQPRRAAWAALRTLVFNIGSALGPLLVNGKRGRHCFSDRGGARLRKGDEGFFVLLHRDPHHGNNVKAGHVSEARRHCRRPRCLK